MIFKSRQVNPDPKPYRRVNGPEYTPGQMPRRSHVVRERYVWTHDPRPEFEPTRDPMPYTRPDGSGRYAHPGTWCGQHLVLSPRREQFDTPVNPLLTELRGDVERFSSLAAAVSDLLDWLERYPKEGPVEGLDGKEIVLTKENIDHARKVLTRLANWSTE